MIRPEQWLAMAHDDLRAAEILAEHGIAQLSCFHSEQATEKALLALRLHQERRGAGGCDSAAAQPAHPDEDGAAIAWEAMQQARALVGRVTDRLYGEK
jgi:hypothetical protein